MAELVNLRKARKRARRQQEETRASANRLAHGQPKNTRALADATREQADRQLDGHRLEQGDDR
jgi:hypothetical protein